MKLEHLIQAYKVNDIEAEVKAEDIAGTINFAKGISASYLLDDEEIVIAMKMFINCFLKEIKQANVYVSYVLEVIKVIQQTIMLLGNVTQHEANMILEKLGLFDSTFKEGKQIKHLSHMYKLEVIEGLLCLSIEEIAEEN